MNRSNADVVEQKLAAIAKKHGGDCVWDAAHTEFFLKRTRGADLCLHYSRQVMVTFFSRTQRQVAKAAFQERLKEGPIAESNVSVEYDDRAGSRTGGVVARFVLGVQPADFVSKIDEVGRGVETIFEVLDKLNAWAY